MKVKIVNHMIWSIPVRIIQNPVLQKLSVRKIKDISFRLIPLNILFTFIKQKFLLYLFIFINIIDLGKLLKCSGESCNKDIYCFVPVNDDNEKIVYIRTGESNNSDCKNINGKGVGKENGDHFLYFDKDDKLVSLDAMENTEKAYLCTFTSSDSNYPLKTCEVVDNKSIVIDNVGVLTCSIKLGCHLDKPQNNSNKYYLLEPDQEKRKEEKDFGTLIETENLDKSGYLYICTNSDNKVSCLLNEINGYYVDGGDLYTCSKDKQANEVNCKKSIKGPEYEGSLCIPSNIGKVLYNTDKYVICTGNNIFESLPEGSKNYIIKYDSSSTVPYGLETNQYGIIKATSSSVLTSTIGKYI